MSKKTRLFLLIPVIAAAAGFVTQASANVPIDEGGGGGGYPGTLYQEVGGGGVGAEVFAARIEFAVDVRHAVSPLFFGRKISVDVEPARRAAKSRVRLAQEAADLVQPLALAVLAEAGHEFHVVLVRMALAAEICFTLT